MGECERCTSCLSLPASSRWGVPRPRPGTVLTLQLTDAVVAVDCLIKGSGRSGQVGSRQNSMKSELECGKALVGLMRVRALPAVICCGSNCEGV
jgi:hypothetical protein